MKQSPAVIDAAPWTYKDGLKIIRSIYDDHEHSVSGNGDPGLLRIKEVLKVTDANISVNRYEEERRRLLYADLVASGETNGATEKWIEFIKDKVPQPDY